MRALAVAWVMSVVLVLAWLASHHRLEDADGWSGTSLLVCVCVVGLWLIVTDRGVPDAG